MRMRVGVIAAGVAVLGVCGGLLVGFRGETASAAPSPTGARAPVIVELFSSEGCSSCPPADVYLATLDRTQPIDGVTVIALEENVDYWDRLGWRDPFGNPAFSERQQEYARVLTDHHVFTPEIVFDGHLVMPGGDEDGARAQMQQSAREPKARVTLRRDGSRVSVDVADVPAAGSDDAPEVWLAITESGLATDVKAGENSGRRLVHAPVVRRLRSLGRVSGAPFHVDTTFDADPAWNARALRVVAFVQLARSKRIVGAAAI
jgi:hypothetical protein